jgi:hypothetical protein
MRRIMRCVLRYLGGDLEGDARRGGCPGDARGMPGGPDAWGDARKDAWGDARGMP